MKLLLLCIFVAVAYGLPANKHAETLDSSEESFIILPFNRHYKKQVPSVVEVEVGDSDEDSSIFPSYFRPLFFNPFSFMNFGFSDFFSRPSWMDSLVPKDIPDSSVKNSTSTTKIVDGHKITVNDTVYENEKNGAVYRFQVVEILPADSQEKGSDERTDKPSEEKDIKTSTEMKPSEDTDGKTEETKVKPDFNSQDNEIHREEMHDGLILQETEPLAIDSNIKVINIGERHLRKRENPPNLGADTRINQLLSENARRGGLIMIPPDVEVFGYEQTYQQPNDYQQQEFEPYNNQAVIKPQYY